MFPILGQLLRDGSLYDSSMPIRVVGGIVPDERAYNGLKLALMPDIQVSRGNAQPGQAAQNPLG